MTPYDGYMSFLVFGDHTRHQDFKHANEMKSAFVACQFTRCGRPCLQKQQITLFRLLMVSEDELQCWEKDQLFRVYPNQKGCCNYLQFLVVKIKAISKSGKIKGCATGNLGMGQNRSKFNRGQHMLIIAYWVLVVYYPIWGTQFRPIATWMAGRRSSLK